MLNISAFSFIFTPPKSDSPLLPLLRLCFSSSPTNSPIRAWSSRLFQNSNLSSTILLSSLKEGSSFSDHPPLYLPALSASEVQTLAFLPFLRCSSTEATAIITYTHMS
ncbi:hypothetical protein PAXRUDRAFT_822814 [Paxillus rubicundulus Ve08.2h10]|uniref:Uncharacterized protein n=1 Tax=Paxillus rubicundulus Ve08.2h10 TaxID=930991 RepID=A0A0D0DW46_9AGAM|nr:hypothetical protein PAXRUDRAFT_822814 [Paxillus rubicundulus Ve08.2h10]